eukprot:NODE_126_length_18761_cov_0.476262.p2 type:complete len:557 gc:universal NODE_126_length_18761_cov_0.476262:4219-5889(+)
MYYSLLEELMNHSSPKIQPNEVQVRTLDFEFTVDPLLVELVEKAKKSQDKKSRDIVVLPYCTDIQAVIEVIELSGVQINFRVSIGYLIETAPLEKCVKFAEFCERKEHNPYFLPSGKPVSFKELCNSSKLKSHGFSMDIVISNVSDFPDAAHLLNYLVSYQYSTEPQNYHFIPRFVLRDFTFDKPNKIKVFDLITQKVKDQQIANVFRMSNMYADTRMEEVILVENSLSNLESRVALLVSIIKGSSLFQLNRTELHDLKTFLFIQAFRKPSRRKQYLENEFDPPTALLMSQFMVKKKFKMPSDVWLDSIKIILESHFDDVVGNMDMFPFIRHEFENVKRCYVCIWEAPHDAEFVMIDQAYGIYEGVFPQVIYHQFYPISPKLMIVLVHPSLKEMPSANQLYASHGMSSRFEGVSHDPPIVACRNPIDNGATESDSNDLFTYQKVQISATDVEMVNGIMLDECKAYLSFVSPYSLLKSIDYYEKNKKKMFYNSKNYAALKLALCKYANTPSLEKDTKLPKIDAAIHSSLTETNTLKLVAESGMPCSQLEFGGLSFET